MSEFTKGPWKAGNFAGSGFNICAADTGKVIGVITNNNDRDRIVACVNACEGLSTDLLSKASLLPDHIAARERISAYTKKVEQQRTELIAIARTFRTHLGGAMCTLDDDDRAMAQRIEDAITAVEVQP